MTSIRRRCLFFELLGEYHNGERLGNQIHQGVIRHIILALAEGDHASPGGFTAVGE